MRETPRPESRRRGEERRQDRPKDVRDADVTLSMLDERARRWLGKTLAQQDVGSARRWLSKTVAQWDPQHSWVEGP
jgi:hypothetical protein